MGFKARTSSSKALDPFASYQLGTLAGQLAIALQERRSEAEAEAAAMGSTRPGSPGYRVSSYRESNTYPAQTHEFSHAFPRWEDFHFALVAADPAALETALELLSRVDPEACLPLALQLIEHDPWNLLWACIGRALARVDDETGFRALLHHHRSYQVTLHIGASSFRHGNAIAMAALRANPAVRGLPYERRDTMFAEGLIKYLRCHADSGTWRYLMELWNTSDETHLRLGCGHALLASSIPACLEVLEGSLDSGKSRALFFGVRAALVLDPSDVFARLGGELSLTTPARREVAAELLAIVALGRPMPHMRSATEALSGDPRMLTLAMAWIGDRSSKDMAQAVINRFPEDMRRAAKPPKVVASVVPAELARMRTIMRVARQNLERIVEILRAEGYRFVAPGNILGVDSDSNRCAIATLEKAMGPLPAALRAAYEIIVHCDLRGSAPDWPAAADPFVLVGAGENTDDAQDHAGDVAQYSLVLAGDALAKDGYSAGSYEILIPCADADPPLQAGHYCGTLVGYLRHSFEWGGFPGLSNHEAPPALLNSLRSACLAIPS